MSSINQLLQVVIVMITIYRKCGSCACACWFRVAVICRQTESLGSPR